MANVIHGTFSLSQILDMTYESKYYNRFEYRKRDVIKKVTVIKETTLHPDRPSEPTITYIFCTFSYPQYGQYLKGRRGIKQRRYRHQYDNILSVDADEDGKFSMHSTKWRYRLGSQKKWVDKPPQSKVKTIYRETMQTWKNEYNLKCESIKKKYSGDAKTKLLKKEKDNLNKKIKNHRVNATYVDPSDWNSKVNGVNGDFAKRVAPVYQRYGHLYGRNVEEIADVDYMHPFACKHMINLIDTLIKLRILV